MVAESLSQEHQKNIENNKLCKFISICADDFGQATPISKGIAELLEQKCINATSCLTNFETFREDALLIKPLDDIYIGLHLNLTEGNPLTKLISFNSINSLLIKSHLRLLNKQQLYNELKAQLDHFIHIFNRKPDFLDGHQHIHHLPQIRDVVLKLYKEYQLKESNTYIRSVYHQISFGGIKAKIIKYSGAYKLEKQLKKLSIPHNTSFGGIYNFNPEGFQQSFEKALSQITDQGLIMCHPGFKYDGDTLINTREVELNYFKSNDFINALEKLKIKLKFKH